METSRIKSSDEQRWRGWLTVGVFVPASLLLLIGGLRRQPAGDGVGVGVAPATSIAGELPGLAVVRDGGADAHSAALLDEARP
jgi:hypothetical protein